MKAAFLFSVLAAATPFAPAATEAGNWEVLSVNGSRIRGELSSTSRDTLVFSSPLLFSPARLEMDQILEITLPPHPPAVPKDHIASVTLSNGDVLRGELAGISGEQIHLRTAWAGDLAIKRSMTDSLDIRTAARRIYPGPGEDSGWEHPSGKWDIRQDALVSLGRGSVVRNLDDLPAKSRFAFHVRWKQALRFNFLFYSARNGKQPPSACYTLVCQNSYVSLRKTDHKGETILGFINVREFTRNHSTYVEILADRNTGVVRLMAGGQLAGEFTDPEPLGEKAGGAIHFSTEDSSIIQFSRIEVTEWDGIIDTPPAPAAMGAQAPDGDDEAAVPDQAAPSVSPVRLRNNDSIDGEMTSIGDGIATLKTSLGEVELPVARLGSLSLHTPEDRRDSARYEIPRIYKGDVRAWFGDDSAVTLRLEKIQDGHLTGYSQALGNVSFDLKAFRKIEFHLYRPELAPVRHRNPW